MSTKQQPTISDATSAKLRKMAACDKENGIKAKFKVDSERAKRFSFDLQNIYVDFSKTHISEGLINEYVTFTKDIEFVKKRHALFAGERINVTEDRAVLHTLLRDPGNQGISTCDPSALSDAESSRQQFLEQYAAIQTALDQRDTSVTDVIHVGIGGSSLGTQLFFEALRGLDSHINIHFIANIDAHHLVSVLAKCQVASTLVIGVSKTFTTTETLQNLNSIAAWFIENGQEDCLSSFYAVTANPGNAVKFGIVPSNTVTFPAWVGGRYSVWSSVSLSAALVLGMDRFREFLEGAAELDRHFYQKQPQENTCFLAAMLDHYYGNFMGAKSRGIFAYDYRLRSLVDYLQQLETESNGKDRQRDGRLVDQETSAVIWGGVGTDVQHSVFQMLHQGTALIPAEFILVKKPDHDLQDHHDELLANGLAQSAALLAGQDIKTVRAIHADEHLSELTLQAKVFSGDRPSTTFLLNKLSPRALGELLAFYEQRTFCSGIFANINSYDQMGVELGKRLAKQLKPLLDENRQTLEVPPDQEPFDTSTMELIKRVTN